MDPLEISALRRRAGLSQEKFGGVLGVSRQTVSQWESGTTSPSEAREAMMHQWKKKLEQFDQERDRQKWVKDLVSSALGATLLVAMAKLFEDSDP
jgi:transcriptional regulator with XRE-family HTH domain